MRLPDGDAVASLSTELFLRRTGVQAGEPAHGLSSVVVHDGAGVLAGLPPSFPAARYHSLTVEEASLPPQLRMTARPASAGGEEVMGVRHAAHPVEGLQFHPESILTAPHGQAIIANFLAQVGRGQREGRSAGTRGSLA